MVVPSTYRTGEPPTGFRSLSEDLRRVLRTELLKNPCSAVRIARIFSMHRRTLHRHLRAEEGLAFRQIAEEIRFELACELLANTDMALGQIAAALKYSELSAFTRAFRRWSGLAPSEWRKSHSRTRKLPYRSRRRESKSSKPGPIIPIGVTMEATED